MARNNTANSEILNQQITEAAIDLEYFEFEFPTPTNLGHS